MPIKIPVPSDPDLATLQARHQLPSLSEAVSFALRSIVQSLEYNPRKESDERAIRAEVNASAAAELRAYHTELTTTHAAL